VPDSIPPEFWPLWHAPYAPHGEEEQVEVEEEAPMSTLPEYLDRVVEVWTWLAEHSNLLHCEPVSDPEGLRAFREGYAAEVAWCAARLREGVRLRELQAEVAARRKGISVPPLAGWCREAGRREALIQLWLELADWQQEDLAGGYQTMLDQGQQQMAPRIAEPSYDSWSARCVHDHDVWQDARGVTHVRRNTPWNS
jgi:hypothetical protein